MLRTVFSRTSTHLISRPSFKPFISPFPLHLQPSLRVSASTYGRFPRTNGPRSLYPAEPEPEPKPKSGPQSDRYSAPGRSLIILFIALSAPISLLNMFPTRVLPPVPDPPHLSHLSHTPLTAKMFLTSPITSAELFIFRLRRGQYATFARENFSFSPVNILGYEDPTPRRWWTLATYIVSHGTLTHWVFCTVAFSSLVPLLASRYGTLRLGALLVGGGVGSGVLTCLHEWWAHGKEAEEIMWKLRSINGTPQMVHVTDNLRGMFAAHVGSSGGLMAMLMVVAAVAPESRWGLMLLPFSVPARVMAGAMVTWDLAGAMGWGGEWMKALGIGHTGHLAGDIVGLLLYAVWLRRFRMRNLRW